MSTSAAELQARQMNDVVTEEVRVLLARRNLRSTALCPVLGLSQQGVSHRMTGRRQWSLNDLDALAHYFGVDANALLPRLGQQGVSGEQVVPVLPHLDSNQEPAGVLKQQVTGRFMTVVRGTRFQQREPYPSPRAALRGDPSRSA